MYDKKTLYTFMKRVSRFFRDNPKSVRIEKIREVEVNPVTKKRYCLAGDVDYTPHRGKPRIRIDYRRDIVATLIHELVHYFYDDLSESKTRRMESALINQLSKSQVRHLLKMLASRL